jgi:predicted N-acetyltransferase YhbS
MLEQALERSAFLLSELPGRLRHLSLTGIEGRITCLTHPLANAVGAAAFSDSDADAAIERTRQIYAVEGKGLTWVVGPITSPKDMGRRLLSAGFVKFADVAGMVLTDLGTSIERNPSVHIRRALPEDLEIVTLTTARGFGLPEEVIELWMEARLLGSGPPRSDVYLAYIDESDLPVGCAALDYVPGLPIVRLGGAATLKEHRGKGVYTSLVAARLTDAADEGMQAAVIQSARVSSEPICRRLGFREICDMAMYSWTPTAKEKELRKLASDWTVR